MEIPACACGFSNPSRTRLSVAETSSSRPDSRTKVRKRFVSSMEITLVPGEFPHFPACTCGLQVLPDFLLHRGHLVVIQSVFLERVIGGMHLHRAQGHHF